ncbi:sensor histidine kinase [Puniceicoccales bacterium CK1056]|uniref:histidine kinase n=1 Tax=Oceanipulchritudo coccoides TaxID=2706888 RepID=A0A6B2M345_9BACT|nr:sensor histidine kinase [Oceanipulchritudo coccoides]NDV62120.1 sensor histidine kinase [Oceanipulchritudo coccoides]
MGNPPKRIEIKGKLRPEKDEILLLDNHGLLNLFNILERQLEGLNALIREDKLKSYSQFCVHILMVISEGDLEEKIPGIEKELEELTTYIRGLIERKPRHLEFFRGILETVEVAHVRLQELNEDRLSWRSIPLAEFRSRLNQFLSATERVSRGKFHFVYPPEEVSPLSYKINFQINSQNEELMAPPVLHDTIRDIVGNARKYSPPGTEITIVLQETEPPGIELSVSDSGIGIPETEIEKVVEYGYRATNAMDRNTMGAGLGLTKAYLLSRKFGGRFIIESTEGKGAKFQLSLFRPT